MALRAWMQCDLTQGDALRRWAPLVAKVARRTVPQVPPGLTYEDILSFGMTGLWQALARYSPGQDTRFESFAVPRIRGAIIDGIRSFSPWSRTQVERLRTVERAIERAEKELGRFPTDEEVARTMGVCTDTYLHMLAEVAQVGMTSLDDLGADLPGSEDPMRELAIAERRRVLAEAIDTLPEREKTIIDLYYFHDLTFREIGAVLGVTESRICQLHAKAVLYLRGKLAPHQSLLCSDGAQ